MKTIKGPALFLAQFAGDAAPFNSLDSICEWAASLGYQGVQIPEICAGPSGQFENLHFVDSSGFVWRSLQWVGP